MENQLQLESIQSDPTPLTFASEWLGWVPHSAQKKILSSFAKYKIVAAGRRFGKSELCAVDALWYAIMNKETIQFVIAPSQDQTRIIASTIEKLAKKSHIVSKWVVNIKGFPFFEMSFVNGSIIHARSVGEKSEGKLIRGFKAHRVIIDEGGYIKKNIIDEVVMPWLADFDGGIIMISTPCGRNHFYDSWLKGQEKNDVYESWQFSSYENPHISHKFIDSQKKNLLDIQFRSEWLAEFIDDQTCVFKWENINFALDDFEESEMRELSHQYYIGVDVAKQHDYTSITVLDGVNPLRVKVVYTERFDNRPYSYVLDRVFALAQVFQPVKILVDETGVGAGPTEQIVSKLANAEGFTFTMPSKIGLINTLKLGFEQGKISISRQNEILINELRYYQYEITDAGNVKMNAPSGKFDDCVISLALAFQCVAVPYADAEAIGIGEAPVKIDNSDGTLPLLNQAAVRSYEEGLVVL